MKVAVLAKTDNGSEIKKNITTSSGSITIAFSLREVMRVHSLKVTMHYQSLGLQYNDKISNNVLNKISFIHSSGNCVDF